MATTLVTGEEYAVDKLDWLGWTKGDGTGTEGYEVAYYLDRDGTYRGPDQHGIEPLFEKPILRESKRGKS